MKKILINLQVFYIDFGTVGEIEIDLLRFMHYDFAKLPIQAIRASLANLKPFKAKHWNVEDTKLFLDLVSGKTLIAELEKIKEVKTELFHRSKMLIPLGILVFYNNV